MSHDKQAAGRYASDPGMGGQIVLGGGQAQGMGGGFAGKPLSIHGGAAGMRNRQPSPLKNMQPPTIQKAEMGGVQGMAQQAHQHNAQVAQPAAPQQPQAPVPQGQGLGMTPSMPKTGEALGFALSDVVGVLRQKVKRAEFVGNGGPGRSLHAGHGHGQKPGSVDSSDGENASTLSTQSPLFHAVQHISKSAGIAGMAMPVPTPQSPPGPPAGAPTPPPGPGGPGAPPPPAGGPPPGPGGPPPGGPGAPPPGASPMPPPAGQPMAPGMPPPGQPAPGTTPLAPPPPQPQHMRQDITGTMRSLLQGRQQAPTGHDATESLQDDNMAMGMDSDMKMAGSRTRVHDVIDAMFGKAAAQDSSKPQRSTTGDSTGLSYAHRSDDYAQGQDAWAATGKYLHKKPKQEPNPFKGDHAGKQADDLAGPMAAAQQQQALRDAAGPMPTAQQQQALRNAAGAGGGRVGGLVGGLGTGAAVLAARDRVMPATLGEKATYVAQRAMKMPMKNQLLNAAKSFRGKTLLGLAGFGAGVGGTLGSGIGNLIGRSSVKSAGFMEEFIKEGGEIAAAFGRAQR